MWKLMRRHGWSCHHPPSGASQLDKAIWNPPAKQTQRACRATQWGLSSREVGWLSEWESGITDTEILMAIVSCQVISVRQDHREFE
jgi:hypothetical protein